MRHVISIFDFDDSWLYSKWLIIIISDFDDDSFFRLEVKILQPEQINIFLSQLKMTNQDSGLVIDQSEWVLENFSREKKFGVKNILG